MFDWLARRRRRKLLATPFPTDWLAVLDANVAHYRLLPPHQQALLRDRLRLLVAEKSWEGCQGFAITPEVQITIAAQASLLLLGRHTEFHRVPGVLVYPGAFVVPSHLEAGPDDLYDGAVVVDERREVAGLAGDREPVLLSWPDVLREGRDPSGGVNVVVHEFAHQFDFLDGSHNGTPPLDTDAEAARWYEVMQAALDRHLAVIDAGDEPFFSPDAEDETEFFADACEALFCAPRDLKAEEPAAYALLAGYFGVDPAGWAGG